MTVEQRLERAASGIRRWRLAAMGLAMLMAGAFVGVQAQPKDGPAVQPGAGQPATPAVPAVRAAAPVVQPSDSVEATTIAIAYHALRSGDGKVTAEAIGVYAAQIMNAYSAARK